ncbi:MAG: hypothetical protein IT435_11315 [Phycisphaerales bacterium]|nr:hypothetical protein [Phycisphaerales bacterium]
MIKIAATANSFRITAGSLQIPGTVDVTPLPSAPLWERLILEQTWVTAGVLLLAAVVWAVVMLKRQEVRRAGIGSGGLALLAASILVLGRVVQTPREIMARQTQEMVFAVADGDHPRLRALLDADAALEFRGAWSAEGREGIMGRVDEYAQYRGQVTDHAVLEVQASRDGSNVGRTQVHVRVSAQGMPVFSWWRLDWRADADGNWTCRRIESLWVSAGVPGRGPGR